MLSEWQRRIGDGSANGHDPRCRMIDVDGIYWCLRCTPPTPLAVFEEFQNQNISLGTKPHACTKEIGRLLGIPAFVAKNHPNRQDPYTEIRYLKTGKIRKFYFQEFANWIMVQFYETHEAQYHKEYRWNATQQRSETILDIAPRT
jgi:hypothetical protein